MGYTKCEIKNKNIVDNILMKLKYEVGLNINL